MPSSGDQIDSNFPSEKRWNGSATVIIFPQRGTTLQLLETRSWAPVPEFDRLRLFKQRIHFTPQANTILDPFMDAGDVLIAAFSLRKRFVGIEIDKQRCDQAVHRIQEFKKTLS